MFSEDSITSILDNVKSLVADRVAALSFPLQIRQNDLFCLM